MIATVTQQNHSKQSVGSRAVGCPSAPCTHAASTSTATAALTPRRCGSRPARLLAGLQGHTLEPLAGHGLSKHISAQGGARKLGDCPSVGYLLLEPGSLDPQGACAPRSSRKRNHGNRRCIVGVEDDSGHLTTSSSLSSSRTAGGIRARPLRSSFTRGADCDDGLPRLT